LVVMLVEKYDIHPDKVEAYVRWSEGAIKRLFSVPGVIEFRGYRMAVGSHQVVCTYEFADLASYGHWRENKEIQKVYDESYTLTLNLTSEIWGPSPVVPKPIRPGK
jgi:antibiotic biosynthesis monooxygenase (ABM) superfamily enzyme